MIQEGAEKPIIYKWSWAKLFIKCTSRKLWIWLITTFIFREVVVINHLTIDTSCRLAVIVGWIIISILYYIGEPLEISACNAIKNAKINLDLGAKLEILKRRLDGNGTTD